MSERKALQDRRSATADRRYLYQQHQQHSELPRSRPQVHQQEQPRVPQHHQHGATRYQPTRVTSQSDPHVVQSSTMNPTIGSNEHADAPADPPVNRRPDDVLAGAADDGFTRFAGAWTEAPFVGPDGRAFTGPQTPVTPFSPQRISAGAARDMPAAGRETRGLNAQRYPPQATVNDYFPPPTTRSAQTDNIPSSAYDADTVAYYSGVRQLARDTARRRG